MTLKKLLVTKYILLVIILLSTLLLIDNRCSLQDNLNNSFYYSDTTGFEWKVSNNYIIEDMTLEKIRFNATSNDISSIAYYNNSLYFILSSNSSTTVLAQFSLQNYSIVNYITIPDEIDSIYFTNNKLYCSNSFLVYQTYINHYESTVYEYSASTFDYLGSFRVEGSNPIVVDSQIYFVRRFTVRYGNTPDTLFLASSLRSESEVVQKSIRLNLNSFNDLLQDGYRFLIMTEDSLEFGALEYLHVEDSLVISRSLESYLVHDSITFDGRYYWLLSLNQTSNKTILFKVDILSYFDQDEDGLSDGAELDAGTSLIDPDTDQDGMQDSFEVKYGLDPLNPADNGTDVDGDGLSNIEEFNLGSDPTKQDTDGDGLTDLEEKELGTNLTAMDTDGDGLIDSADPRPLTPLRYWERIGPYWVVVIAGFVVLVILLKTHHERNK